MSFFGFLTQALVFAAVLLAAPYALVIGGAAALRKKPLPAGIWLAVSALGLVGCAAQVMLAVFMPILLYGQPTILKQMLSELTMLLWYTAAMLFPLLAGVGKRCWAKALLLLPILIFFVVSMFRYFGPMLRMGSFAASPFLVYLPLLLMLLLTAVWYVAGKNRIFGILVAVLGLGTLLMLPLNGIAYYNGLQTMRLGFGEHFRLMLNAVQQLFQAPIAVTLGRYCTSLASTYGVPLPTYLLLAQLIALLLAGKNAPEKGRKAVTEPVRAEEPVLSKQPVQPKFCPQCGQPLPDGAKFCAKCGRSLI